jgi:hypothetical protein
VVRVHYTCMYRSPSGPILDFIDELDIHLSNLRHVPNLIVTGDMNINIDPCLPVEGRNICVSYYLDVLANNCLIVHYIGTTRCATEISMSSTHQQVSFLADDPVLPMMCTLEDDKYVGTQIDHFCTRVSSCGNNSSWATKRIECTLSDHFGIYSALPSRADNDGTQHSKTITKINYSKLDKLIDQIDFDEEIDPSAPDHSTSNVIHGLTNAIISSSYTQMVPGRKYRLQL